MANLNFIPGIWDEAFTRQTYPKKRIHDMIVDERVTGLVILKKEQAWAQGSLTAGVDDFHIRLGFEAVGGNTIPIMRLKAEYVTDVATAAGVTLTRTDDHEFLLTNALGNKFPALPGYNGAFNDIEAEMINLGIVLQS